MTKPINTLHSLQRGELAATETYQQILRNFKGFAEVIDLEEIRKDHRTAANALRQHIREHGDVPEKDSGTWGTFAKAVEGTAKVFGQGLALKALKEGEERGIKDYENALADQELQSDCRVLIETELLPKTRAHVSVLSRLISGQKA
ncbi:MAG: DUF2383 domain-containing protein [Planctomycetaceae bacterium]|nr:DUF2383 domain-containing protein [Planctomycetaceae bacterium]